MSIIFKKKYYILSVAFFKIALIHPVIPGITGQDMAKAIYIAL